ncbi:unnamed protein product [Paramecium sonneborni]|uniref:Uncharacterized protein n=1 Tax=Paramecium sonneborni TaxID=65129 RepID=A0A8S1PMD6_9CILI|nr:unnamed protein product [Paramecium sonneborni]
MILKYCFGIYKFNPIIIQIVLALLKAKSYPANENIQYQGDVRVINEKNKLLGVMPFSQAKEQPIQQEKYIILLNENVESPLCIICDYSDELAQRFLTEISSPSFFQIITLKKYQNRILGFIGQINSSTNYSKETKENYSQYQLDIYEQFIKSIGNIRSCEYINTSEQYGTKDEQKQPQIELEYEFEKIGEIQQSQPIPQLKIERQINQTFNLNTRQELLNADEFIKEFYSLHKDTDKKDREIDQENFTKEKIWTKDRTQKRIIKYTYPIKGLMKL